MTSIFEITDWAHVASFFVWTLAVCALAKAIFGSFPAAELQYHLALRDNPRRQRINRLNWEVANRTKWDEDVARGSQHAAKQPLTDPEIGSRRIELQQLARSSLAWRAFTYFMGCFACQAFWTALAVYVFTHGMSDLSACLLTAAAYSGAAVPLLNRVGGVPSATRAPSKPGCKNCNT